MSLLGWRGWASCDDRWIASHAFVDESRRGGRYIVCASVVLPSELATVRKMMRSQLLSGQARLHFKTEKPSRRRALLAVIAELNLTTLVCESNRKEADARRWALGQLLAYLAGVGGQRLVIEAREASLNLVERQTITAALTRGRGPAGLSYEHMRPHEEPILWVSDAVAWAYSAGGDWRRRVTQRVVLDSS